MASPLAQVRLVDSGLRFPTDGVSHITYDDTTLQVLLVRNGNIEVYSCAGQGTLADPGTQPQPQILPLDNASGPPIRSLRASPDGQLLALHRSPTHVEFMHTRTGNMFVQGPSSSRRTNTILGVLWVLTPSADLVLVTAAGLGVRAAGQRAGPEPG